MLEKLQSIRERALERLNQAADTGALEQIRVAVLGKKGELTALLRWLWASWRRRSALPWVRR